MKKLLFFSLLLILCWGCYKLGISFDVVFILVLGLLWGGRNF